MAGVKETLICDIPVIITKKKMKNLYLRVDKQTGVVKVSIPNSVSFKEAEEFVRKNIDWIIKNREEVEQRTAQLPHEYCNGESIELWGKNYEIEFVPSYCDKGVYVRDDKVVILAPLDSDKEYREALVNRWYRQELSDAIDLYKEHCCLVTGVSPKEWRIKDMKTKWGTCNYTEGRIWLSLNLVHRPRMCLEYVMYHELTHLYVPNHGPEFKAYMDRFCPDWRKIKRILNG